MSRKLVRHAAADWFNAAQIPGLDHVYPGKPKEILWAKYSSGTNLCQAWLFLGPRREQRIAYGGDESGEKEINSLAHLIVTFRSSNPDWLEAQDDMDDVTESLVEQLRAGGRKLGRPDVVLSAGEFEAGIEQQDEEPVAVNGGLMQAVCVIVFEITEIINS
jgi:hypothetical protein